MLYRVADVSVDGRSGMTCLVVEFWKTRRRFDRGLPANVVNDFYNNYNPNRQVPVTDKQGRVRYGGVFLAPWVEQDGQWVRRPDPDLVPDDITVAFHDDIIRWWKTHGDKVKGSDRLDRQDKGRKPKHEPAGALADEKVRGFSGRVWSDEEP